MARLLLLALCVFASGCRMPFSSPASLTPVAATDRLFDQVTRLEISSRTTVEVSDPEKIRELREVFRRANWRPFIATVPSGMIPVRAYRNNEVVFSFAVWSGSILWWSKNSNPGLHPHGVLKATDVPWMLELVREATVIPAAWLTQKVIPAEIEPLFAQHSTNTEWQFFQEIQPGDEVWEFRQPPNPNRPGAELAGFVLVRDGAPTDRITKRPGNPFAR